MAATDVSTDHPAVAPARSGRLRLGALTALVIGSMVGAGVFSLPQNTAAA